MHDQSLTSTLAIAGIHFIERGWLSANNTLLRGEGPTALVDSGYWTHASQTLALVREAAADPPVELLINTHLHSDHCGGNAALQQAYPSIHTLIPPGQAASVDQWDPVALTYEPTGQHCPAFRHNGVLVPGSTLQLGPLHWQIHSAKGHDPHSIVLFEPTHRILISADALWENGFGVVFPELEGISAFDEVAQTLDMIERLEPAIVLPGHGRAFTSLRTALTRARSRLDQFQCNPAKHQRHAWKVLIKYKLLEWQHAPIENIIEWARATPILAGAMPDSGRNLEVARDWVMPLLHELDHSGALQIREKIVFNC